MSSLVVMPVVWLFYMGHRWIRNLSPAQLSLVVGAVVLLLIPYVKLIQPWIDHLFQRRKHDLHKILQDFIHEISVLKTLDELVGKLQATISSVLYPEQTSIVLLDVKSDGLKVIQVAGLPRTFSVERHSMFFKWLELKNVIMELDLIEQDSRYSQITDAAKDYFSDVQG